MVKAIEKKNAVQDMAGYSPGDPIPYTGPVPGEPLYEYDQRKKCAEAQYDAEQAARKGRKRKWPIV